MAEMSLDRLFQRIIESEQTEENRREHIATLKRQIREAEGELKSLNDSCTSSKGRLHVLVRQYYTEKAECSVLTAQKSSLERQKVEIVQDIEKFKNERAEKEKKINDMQSAFSRDIRLFCADFDLTGDGTRKRRAATMEEISLVDKKLDLEKEKYNKLLKEEEKVTEAMEQRICLQAEISQLQSQIIDADSQLERKKQEARAFAAKVDQVRAELERNPELVQLQNKFESASKQNRDLENKVRNLKAEIARIKRNQSKNDEVPSSAPPTKLYKFHSFV